jgi:hypothetical protein
MVAYVLDPAACDLGDVYKTFLVLVLDEVDKGTEVLDFGDFAYDEFAGFGPAGVLHAIAPRLLLLFLRVSRPFHPSA